MTFEEFYDYVFTHIKDFLPESAENVQLTRYDKPLVNGGCACGITIHRADSNVAPCLYLNDSYEHFQEGRSLDNICIALAQSYMDSREATVPYGLDTKLELENVRDKITPKVLNHKLNRSMLKARPYTVAADLAVVYQLEYPGKDGVANIAITDEILAKWNISVDELHSIAESNTRDSYVLTSIMNKLFGNEEINFLKNDVYERSDELLVLTNESGVFGASALANPKVLKAVAEAVHGDVYILPSSIHEVLVISKDVAAERGMDPRSLGKMVREVNETEVSKDERLADHIYEYGLADRELKVVQASKERNKDIER